MKIRKYLESDWAQVWLLSENIFRAGETYPYPLDITEEEAHNIWVQIPKETYVATNDENKVVGTYYIKPNQPGLGSHVCNCGYIVSESARGQGIASELCKHSQSIAVDLGFKAMQYNLVVSTNKGAIYLWKKMGFQEIGKLPKAFKSKSRGYVDALIMYKQL